MNTTERKLVRMMADTFLKLDHIKKYFGGVKALKGVSLEVRSGEIHCLAGEKWMR